MMKIEIILKMSKILVKGNECNFIVYPELSGQSFKVKYLRE